MLVVGGAVKIPQTNWTGMFCVQNATRCVQSVMLFDERYKGLTMKNFEGARVDPALQQLLLLKRNLAPPFHRLCCQSHLQAWFESRRCRILLLLIFKKQKMVGMLSRALEDDFLRRTALARQEGG